MEYIPFVLCGLLIFVGFYIAYKMDQQEKEKSRIASENVQHFFTNANLYCDELEKVLNNLKRIL